MSKDWRSADLPAGVTQRIFLVRHGETEASARGRCYGKLDVALSANGRTQMQQTAKLLQPLAPQKIYSSPRIRALDSAEYIADACQLSIEKEPDLAELDFGDLEGMRYEDVERDNPEFYAQWMQRPTEVTFPNGESYTKMRQRVLACMQRILSDTQGQKTVLVAHGGVIRIILADLLQLQAEMIFRLDQSYAAVSCVDFYTDSPVIRALNWLP